MFLSFLGNALRSLFKKSHIDDYEIFEKIGSGGAANVYKCKKKSNGKEYVIKKLQKTDSDKKKRFIREIEAMNKCKESGIDGVIPILDYDVDEYWYVMPKATCIDQKIEEYKEKIKNPKVGEEDELRDEILSYFVNGFICIAETLEKIHEINIIHRDIKPSNLYWYNDRFSIGDFGIVDIPDGDKKLTKKGDRLGAWNTIAPEVLKDAKKNTTTKSDVYSLAKSLWICLALDNDSFVGPYDANNEINSLHDKKHLMRSYLIDIDELLIDATQDDPQKRPSMKEFKKKLILWRDCSLETRSRKEWTFLLKNFVRGKNIKTAEYEDIDSIIETLKELCRYGSLNSVMLPDKGWGTLTEVEKATEKDCIYLRFHYDIARFTILCKAKKLVYHGFADDVLWNYYYLDFDSLNPIIDNKQVELLVEDKPGNYVSALDAVYGVYDYDGGIKFPKGAKLLERYCSGSIVIVSKQSFYNGVLQTTDGRHNVLGEEKFFEYIKSIKKIVKAGLQTGLNMNQISYLVGNMTPVKNELTEEKEDGLTYDPDYLINNASKLSFSSVLKDEGNGNASYCFYMYSKTLYSLFDSIPYYFVCKDGSLKLLQDDSSSDIFWTHDRISAESILEKIEEEKSKFLQQNSVSGSIGSFFHVRIKLTKYPNHIFNFNEVKNIVVNADDRKDNYIVVDEDGNVKAINDNNYEFYPVRTNKYCSRHNYLGKYCDCDRMASALTKELLARWLEYLKTKQEVAYGTSYDESIDVRDIREEIKNIISNNSQSNNLGTCGGQP